MPNLSRKRNSYDIRRISVIGAVFLLFLFLFLKLFLVQIFMYDKINKAVKQMTVREKVEIPKRGDILDAKGRVLATSVKKYSLFLDPRIIENYPLVRETLASYGVSLKEKSLKDFGNTAYVQTGFECDYETYAKIKEHRMRGVGFETKYARSYPEGRLLSHVLGITGRDGSGLEGVEKNADSYLAGESAKTLNFREAKGNFIVEKTIKDLIPGLDVELTIDKNIQFIAEQELRKAFADFKPKKALCIVQNPKTGAVLAMVSLPDFDSSEKIDASLLKNSAVSDFFEPGSTFKIVTVAAALEEKKIKLNEIFYLENGKMKIGKHTINDDHQIKGYASLSKSFEQSSNIAMVKIAGKLDKKPFYDYIRKFGFYSLSGIDLPGEAKGRLLDEKNWSALSLPSISFGQEIGVSALQLINAYSAIANGGVLMKPLLIKNIGSQSPQDNFKPKEIRRVISEETSEQMRKLLKNVVENGTGKSAKAQGYDTGGKTGTAQKYDAKIKKYSKKHYIASFCGMVPALNPEVVILVVFDEPKGDYYASSVASPVFAKIAKRTAEYLEITKTTATKEA
jgi:cell division protein FtsI (penicillin-binding protein 3)